MTWSATTWRSSPRPRLMVLGVIFSAFVNDADAAATMAAVPRAGVADPLAEAA